MVHGHVLKRERQYFGHHYVLCVGVKDGEGKKREKNLTIKLSKDGGMNESY